VTVTSSGCPYSGTSFAAPAVSGLIAQLLAANPTLTVAQVTAAFMQAAANNGYWKPTFGMVNTILNTPNYSLTVTTAGTGGGTVTANPPGASYTSGTTVVLTAVPNSGSSFVGWSGDAAGTSSTVAVLMDANKSITATFNQNPPTTVRSHTMTSVPGTTAGCPAPPSVYTFPPTAAEADSWLLIDYVQAGSAVQWDWYRPDGVFYTSSIENFPNRGSFCVAMPLFIEGYVPSGTPGTWFVQVFYNQTLLFRESFQITGLGHCDGLSPVNACGPCNTSADCGGGDCWTSSPIPPFCP
jgi:uncharacterized repeat protein (TIGR02543 family)